jgi:hypothetical protein
MARIRPIHVECETLADVGSPERLAAQTSDGRHVVLRFSSLGQDDKATLIRQLSAALPDHSVFESSGGSTRVSITVLPVVPRSRVVERRTEVLRAVEEYRRSCVSLRGHYQNATFAPEWEAHEHGEHCRFESRRTGQVVEAPLGEGSERVVAELISDDFHDAARALELVALIEPATPSSP